MVDIIASGASVAKRDVIREAAMNYPPRLLGLKAMQAAHFLEPHAYQVARFQ
jgi:hypothetical protein